MKRIVTLFVSTLLVFSFLSCDFIGGDQTKPFYRGNWQNTENNSEFLRVTANSFRIYRISDNTCVSALFIIEEYYEDVKVFTFKHSRYRFQVEKIQDSIEVSSPKYPNNGSKFKPISKKVPEICEETDNKKMLKGNPFD